jgi:hypothetical protein
MKLFIKSSKSNRQTQLCKNAGVVSKIVIVSTLVIFFLAGCGNTTQNEKTGSSVTPSGKAMAPDNEANTQETPTKCAEGTDATASPSYKIITSEFNQDNIQIQYPQIEKLGNEPGEKAINDLIKNDIWDSQVEDIIKYYQEDGSTIKLNVDLNYKVTMNTDDILSVMYTGTAYIEGGMHPDNVFHAITVDLKSGNRVSLSNFTKIDASLIQKIKESKSVTNDAVKYEEDEAQAEDIRKDLITLMQNQDDQNMILTLKNDSEKDFYVTKNSLVVCVIVCHAAGDYMLVEIPGQYMANTGSLYDDNLCSDNENLLISFMTKKSGKSVSVCSSKDNQYIVYRFGTKDNIELEYPTDKDGSWDKFVYSYYHRGGGAGNCGYDMDSLAFKQGKYKYELYQEYDAVSDEKTVGVKVIDTRSGKETDIIGDADTLTENWSVLKGNENVNIIAQ